LFFGFSDPNPWAGLLFLFKGDVPPPPISPPLGVIQKQLLALGWHPWGPMMSVHLAQRDQRGFSFGQSTKVSPSFACFVGGHTCLVFFWWSFGFRSSCFLPPQPESTTPDSPPFIPPPPPPFFFFNVVFAFLGVGCGYPGLAWWVYPWGVPPPH